MPPEHPGSHAVSRPARSPLRRRLLQAQILNAAADRFQARGYRATTLDEIARGVGMSKATLYRYFRSKEALLAAIFHRTMALFERELARVRACHLPADEELRRVIRHHVRTVVAERSFLTVFFEEEAHLPRHLGRAITRRKAGYDRILLDIVEGAMARGERRIDLPPRLLVFALLGMSNWVYTWYRPGRGWTPDAIADAFIALIERGYRPSPGWRRHDVVKGLDRIAREMRALRPVADSAARPRRPRRRRR
jgi:AcrR family transcriptional regulator